LSDVDLFSLVGRFVAYNSSIENVLVTDGALTIEVETIIDAGTLAGISISSDTGEYVEPEPVEISSLSPEKPGLDICPISSLPSADSLPTSSGLPDPFTKLDGTRITTKSGWQC
jgi:hypothetical protein